MPTTCQDITNANRRIADLEALVDALEAGSCSAEGTYTTWTITGIWDSGFVSDIGNDISTPRNNGNILYHDMSTRNTYIASSAGALLATLPNEKGIFSGRGRSLTDRYMIFRGLDNNDVIVQEGIGETWRRDIKLDRGAYSLVANPIQMQHISPSGEWITVLTKEATTDNGLVFIYQGS